MKVKLRKAIDFYRQLDLSTKECVTIAKGAIVEVEKMERIYLLKGHGTICFSEAEEVPDTFSKDEILQRVYTMLCKQRFAHWYNDGDFDQHIQGDEDRKPLKAIKEDIARFLNL